MDNLIDFKKIWSTANTSSLPAPAEMVSNIKSFRKKMLVKKAALILGALFLTSVMIMTAFFYKSHLLSTRVGEICIVIAGIILITTNTRSLKRAYKLKNCTNQEFIEYLKQVQVNRIYYHNKTQVTGLAFSSAGLLLYLFEFLHNNIFLSLICYTVIGAYLLILWLVIRPKLYQKQKKEFESTFKKMENLSKQINQNL